MVNYSEPVLASDKTLYRLSSYLIKQKLRFIREDKQEGREFLSHKQR